MDGMLLCSDLFFLLLLLVIVVIEKFSAKYSYKLLGAYFVVIFPQWDLLKNVIVQVIQGKAAFISNESA